jgi:hypothetical protein
MLSRQAAEARFARQLWLAVLVAGLVVLVAGVILAVAGARTEVRLLIAGMVFVALGIVVMSSARTATASAPWFAIAALPAVLFCCTELWLRPVFSFSPAAALAAKLRREQVTEVCVVNMPPSLQAQIRVFAEGKLAVTPLPADWRPERALEPVIFSAAEKAQFAAGDGRIEQVGFASGKWRFKEYLNLLHPSKASEAMTRNRIPYFIFYPGAALRP